MSQSARPRECRPSLTLDEIQAQLEALPRVTCPPTADAPSPTSTTPASPADAIGREVLASFSSTNGLDPTAFPSLLAMENDLVGIAGRLVDAPDGFAGVVTSGGTESILLAVLAARDARPTSPHRGWSCRRPRMLPSTRPRTGSGSSRSSSTSTRRRSSRPRTRWPPPSTSAPSSSWPPRRPTPTASSTRSSRSPQRPLPRGAVPRGCHRGWVLPPARRRDQSAPWTFAVEGVTSLSLDLHKHAYTPKGVSILLHASAALRRTHLFASAGGPATRCSTRRPSRRSPAARSPTAWAVVHHIGADRYEAARTARVAALASRR